MNKKLDKLIDDRTKDIKENQEDCIENYGRRNGIKEGAVIMREAHAPLVEALKHIEQTNDDPHSDEIARQALIDTGYLPIQPS